MVWWLHIKVDVIVCGLEGSIGDIIKVRILLEKFSDIAVKLQVHGVIKALNNLRPHFVCTHVSENVPH